MYPKAAVDVSMLVPSISHAQIPNPVKCKMPLQSPTFSRFQPKNHPLDSTKTLIFVAQRDKIPGHDCCTNPAPGFYVPTTYPGLFSETSLAQTSTRPICFPFWKRC